MKKKLLLFLFCVFVGHVFSQTAVQPSGSGTKGDPYQIATLENLYWVSQNSSSWNRYFEQTADIDASSSSTWDDGAGWLPIGSLTTEFTGRYNGQGYVINGLYINRTTNYIGFFGNCNQAHIDSLGITNLEYFCGNNTGGLVGYSNYTIINQCYTTGTINIINSSNIIGGLIGTLYRNNECKNSFSECNIVGNSTSYYIGGFLGFNSFIANTIQNCYAAGDVSGQRYVGGFIGRDGYPYTNGIYFYHCYSTGKVSRIAAGDDDSYYGGFSGGGVSPTVNGCFWDIETSGWTSSRIASGKTTGEMHDYNMYINAGWDFIIESNNGSEDIWVFNPDCNDGYPSFKWHYSILLDSVGTTATAYYQVTNVKKAIVQQGICWNTSGTPTLADQFTSGDVALATGSFTSAINGIDLKTSSTFVRAYFINVDNDTLYSNTIDLGLPVIESLSVNHITDSSARAAFSFLYPGIPAATQYGVCWNTSGTPTLNDIYTAENNVAKAGDYTTNISGLSSNTDYYARAYAITAIDTVFSSEISFKAVNGIVTPSVDTLRINGIIGNAHNYFYLVNTGEVSVGIDSFKIEKNSIFSINASLSNIAVNDRAVLTVDYHPTTITSDTTAIIIYSNAGADTMYAIGKTEIGRSPDAGNALEFDGSNDYIDCGRGIDLANKSFSIDFWFKRGSINTNDYIIGLGDNYSTNMAIHIGFRSTNYFTFAFYANDIDTYSTYTDMDWHHWAVTYDAATKEKIIYRDGIIAGSGIGSSNFVNSEGDPFWIGRGYDGSYSDGKIDEVRVWDKTLTREEIRSQYGPLSGNEDGLVAYWRFDEADGDYTFDATGNGNTGTLINGAAREIPSTAPVGEPVLTALPESLSLGSLLSGDSKTLSYKLANTGGGILHIDAVNYDNTNFVVATEADAVFSGDTIEAEIIFTPKDFGNFNSYVKYFHNMGADSLAVEAYCVSLPTFSNITTGDITGTNANISFQVDELGIPAPVQYGICWNTSGTPSLDYEYTNEGAMTETGTYSSEAGVLRPITDYYARAYVINGTHVSYSDEISFTTIKQTPVITWSAPADITYGTALGAEQLNATVDANGTLTYSPEAGTLLDAGDNQELSVTFTPSSTDSVFDGSTTVNINVAKAVLTVTADDASRIYGESNPELTFTYSGFVNSEDESVLDTKPTASTEATAASTAGEYDIVVSGGSDNNYAFSYTNGTLTITRVSAVIDETFARVSVYPNPAVDIIYIRMDQNVGSVIFKLISVTGKTLDTGMITNDLEPVDMSGYNPGVYILQLIQGESIASYRILKK